MKYFCFKLAVFSFVFFLLDKPFIIFRNISPGTQSDRRLESILLGDMNKDLVILGSSRGSRDVLASRIQSRLNLLSFNLCYPGSNIEFHEYLLNTLLAHNKAPRFVILVLDDKSELQDSKSLRFRYDRLYPLVKYREIRKELVSRGQKNAILTRLFILHQLNRSNFDIRKKYFNSLDTMLNDGSKPISFKQKGIKWKYTRPTSYNSTRDLKNKVHSFLNLQETCLKNNIELIFAFPPNFRDLNSKFHERIGGLALPRVKTFMYDTSDVRYRNIDYFSDTVHLRTTGAEIFTDDLIRFLGKIL